MNDHSTGLGVSPGWTKTQATEKADHKPENGLNSFRCFQRFLHTYLPRVDCIKSTRKQGNTLSHVFHHQNILNNKLFVQNRVELPNHNVTATYQNGENSPLNFSTTQKPFYQTCPTPETRSKRAGQTNTMTELSISQRMMLSAYSIYLNKEKDLDFSTWDKYRRRAKKQFQKTVQTEKPPHLENAVQEIQDYTS